MKYLTKSDFLTSLDCNRKLYYKKNNYTNYAYEDEFMSLLAEGGLLVEYVAKMLFEDGIEIDFGSNENNIAMSNKYIEENENVTLFSPSFRYEKALSRLDILVKEKNTLYLYDVHSVSFNGENEVLTNKNGTIKADKKKLIYDIGFQTHILKNKYPDLEIVPILMVLDKTKKNKYPNLLNNFKFEKTKIDELDNVTKPIIEFTGLKKEIVLDNDLFVKVDVSDVVNSQLDYIHAEIDNLSAYIKDDIIKPACTLSKICKTCEFKDGKNECWENMPKHENDIFDLYHNTTQKLDKVNVLNDLILERKTNLFDWPIDKLKVGKITKRQRIQLENTESNSEWFDNNLLNEINEFKYPLHFIDFETTRPAIPHNKNDKPYEQLAFQWSCHTIDYPGADIEHKEWISFEKGFPNFKFAESLMKHLKKRGSVFMWHHHERNVLKDIIRQINERDYDNPELLGWLTEITNNERMIDMNVLAKEYYFHPEMKGQTSIKKVLPAVWNNSEYVKNEYNISKHFTNEQLNLTDPYKILEDRNDLVCKQFDKINIGTDAIVAYQQMMRDLYMGDHINAKNIKTMLLEYCKLDTLAMYIIYIHWHSSLLDRISIENNIKENVSNSLTSNNVSHCIVRKNSLYKGIMFDSFREIEKSELRMIHLDKNDLTFEFYHTNSSNTRISTIFKLEDLNLPLLSKIDRIINSQTNKEFNAIYTDYYNERKELHNKIEQVNDLSDEESDRLRFLNDELQKIIDNHDEV